MQHGPDFAERLGPGLELRCYKTRSLRPVADAVGVRLVPLTDYIRLGMCLLYVEWPGLSDPLVFPAAGFASMLGYLVAAPLPAEVVKKLLENGTAVLTWARENVCKLPRCFKKKVRLSRDRYYCLCIPEAEKPAIPELEASIDSGED